MMRTIGRAFAGVRKVSSRKGRRAFRPGVGELESRLVMAAGVGLSPPWVTFHDEVAATVGKTPGVIVSPLVQVDSGHYFVTVSTNNVARGVALASVLEPNHDFGGVNVGVIVTNTRASIVYAAVTGTGPAEVALGERVALSNNPMFRTVVTQPIFPGQPATVFPVFTKTVVQFPNDNLADAFQNFNAVTASAFADVLAGQVVGVDVSPSTATTQPKPPASGGATLSPPWFTFRNELANTVGRTPQVVVSPLVQTPDGNYVVTVTTANATRGVALATTVAGGQDFGNVHVNVVVNSPTGLIYNAVPVSSSSQLATLDRTALGGNPLFVTVVTHALLPGGADTVFPVFTKSVVQFFNDNLADAYRNFNAVTASAFGDVLAGSVGGFDVSPSTSTR